MNISGLFNISLRLLLDENSISKLNDLAGKGLNRATRNNVIIFSTNTFDSATNKRIWYNDNENNEKVEKAQRAFEIKAAVYLTGFQLVGLHSTGCMRVLFCHCLCM